MNTSASTDVLAVFVDAGNVAAPLLGYEARPEGAQLAAMWGTLSTGAQSVARELR